MKFIISAMVILLTGISISFAKHKGADMTQAGQKKGVTLALTILYVKDQAASAKFYRHVLDLEPVLDVPGMTQFTVENGFTFGLMPEQGIKRLLGEKMPDPSKGSGIPRAELYLQVISPAAYHRRALEAGAIEISPLTDRPWGEKAAYSLDPDGHVLAFGGE